MNYFGPPQGHTQQHPTPPEAGPSRPKQMREEQQQQQPGQPHVGYTESNGDASAPAPKRVKIKRSRQACFPCRVKKRKCGGAPPAPCPNCLEDQHECQWPVEDGRSSSARRDKAKNPGKSPSNSNSGGEWWNNIFADFAPDLASGWPPPPPHAAAAAGTAMSTGSTVGATDPFMIPMDLSSAPHTTLSGSMSSVPLPLPLDVASQLSLIPIPDWPESVDPQQFVMALSSRVPMIEPNSAQDETSPLSDSAYGMPNMQSNAPRLPKKGKGKMVKITWWRPHGMTAIAPGLKKMTLKVRLDEPGGLESRSPATESQTGVELFDRDRVPNPGIMRHLLELFAKHYGCQMPGLDLIGLQRDLEAGNGSVFLLNCVAAVAARFSTHPSIAQPDLKPHEYGNPFFRNAKDMLGSMLGLPSRETVMALVLLCHAGFGNDSEAEEWMFAGMAVRMAIDLGLHLDPGDDVDISAEDRRQNRLVFWTVVLLDFALAFGTGRQPTFRVDEITQRLPTESDVPMTGVRHPFPYAVSQMYSYGSLIELINSRKANEAGIELQKDIQAAKFRAIKAYGELPEDLQWNVSNLQRQALVTQVQIYLQLHLWMHTIIASGYLTGTDYMRREHRRANQPSEIRSGAVTPNRLAASNVWRNSARTIGDILVLSDIICPESYLALPFCNQAFYVAGSCYVKELESEHDKTRAPSAEPPSRRGSVELTEHAENGEKTAQSAEFFKAILKTVSTENISTLRKGLARQTVYWSGVAWVAEAMEQRIQGIGASEIDLVSVTEKLASIASVPDPGLLRPHVE